MTERRTNRDTTWRTMRLWQDASVGHTRNLQAWVASAATVLRGCQQMQQASLRICGELTTSHQAAAAAWAGLPRCYLTTLEQAAAGNALTWQLAIQTMQLAMLPLRLGSTDATP